MQPMRLHSHHGQNIHISDDRNTATRTCSFAHGICFGDRPLNQVSGAISCTLYTYIYYIYLPKAF